MTGCRWPSRCSADSGNAVVGAVVLSRSSGELDERVGVLWAWLAAVGLAVLAAAAVAAMALARWVRRPLSALDAAAQRLGSGALETRSAAGQGRPRYAAWRGTSTAMAGRLESLVHGNRARWPTLAPAAHPAGRAAAAAGRARPGHQPGHRGGTGRRAGEIARLSQLVDGLLAVARAENGVTEPVSVRVDEVIRDRVAAWRPVAEERGVELTLAGSGPVLAMLGEGHLEQILDNLIANALDAVLAGGHIRVSAQPGGQGALVAVADDGRGMSQGTGQRRRRSAGSPATPPAGPGSAWRSCTGSSRPTAGPPPCRTPRAAGSPSP